jgi:hypothetical protein
MLNERQQALLRRLLTPGPLHGHLTEDEAAELSTVTEAEARAFLAPDAPDPKATGYRAISERERYRLGQQARDYAIKMASEHRGTNHWQRRLDSNSEHINGGEERLAQADFKRMRKNIKRKMVRDGT